MGGGGGSNMCNVVAMYFKIQNVSYFHKLKIPITKWNAYK